MKKHVVIILLAFLVLLGLVVWAVLSGPGLKKEPIPTVNLPSLEGNSSLRVEAGMKPIEPLPEEVSSTIPVHANDRGPDDPSRNQPLPDALAKQVEQLKSASIPIKKRRAELEALARKDDAAAAAVLMAVGNEHTYLNAAAVAALEDVKIGGVVEYLQNKLNHSDPKVLSAAVSSLALQQGEDAIPAIAAVLKRNRKRPDGYQDTVCAACVQALAGTGSARAVPVLAAELRETVGVTLEHDYGSKVVAALLAIKKPEARPVLLDYADRLAAIERKAPDNPMGKQYMLQKIKEARAAAEALAP